METGKTKSSLKNIEKNYEHLEDFYMQTIATNVSRDKVSKKDEKSEKISDSLISKEKQVKTKKENQ